MLEQSFLRNIFGGFFEFLRSVAQESRKFTNGNYAQFKKDASEKVSTVKQYFAWLNKNLPLTEKEMYYIPDDEVDPSDFDKDDFISPFVYGISSVNNFNNILSDKEESWGSEFATDESVIFDAILCSSIMDSRKDKQVYKKLVDSKVDIGDVSNTIIKKEALEKGIQSAQKFQSILADFFACVALFAKTIEYVGNSSETARNIDDLFSDDKNLNFLSKNGFDRFRKKLESCFQFASDLSVSFGDITKSIRDKMPPEYGNFEMSQEEWENQAKNIPDEFWEIDTMIKNRLMSIEDDIDKVRTDLLKYINAFEDSFIYNDVNYEIEDYCTLEAEICELYLRQNDYEEELREKRGAGEEAQYLVDIVNEIRKDKIEKEKEIETFKGKYSSMIQESKIVRDYVRNILQENFKFRGVF